MNRNNILLLLGTVAIFAGLVGVYFYQQKTPDASAYTTDLKISAEELYAAYESDEAAANERFLGKTIEVSGTVKEVARNAENGTTTVHLETDGLLGTVSCELATNVEETLEPGDSVNIKGICSGMLMDVVLNRCVIR